MEDDSDVGPTVERGQRVIFVYFAARERHPIVMEQRTRAIADLCVVIEFDLRELLRNAVSLPIQCR